MPKNKLFFLALVIILITVYTTLAFNSSTNKALPKNEIETAINQAKHLYSLRVKSGQDLSTGPCLSDALMPGWVVDIIHSPRVEVDDLVENQCPSYVEGRSLHLVELDTAGNFVRAK